MQSVSQPPAPEDLHKRLGQAAPLWKDAISQVRALSANLLESWHFASPKIGWSLRLVEGKRVLVYLTPGEGQFRVGLVLGKKAVVQSREAGLSRAAVAIIDTAPTYAEGHGVRFEVASEKDIETFRELLAVKVPKPPKPHLRGKRA